MSFEAALIDLISEVIPGMTISVECALDKLMREAFFAGFLESGEGFNAEYPVDFQSDAGFYTEKEKADMVECMDKLFKEWKKKKIQEMKDEKV